MPSEEHDAVLLQELFSTGALVGALVDTELERAGVPQQLFSFLGWIATLQPVTPRTLAAETGLPPTTIRDHVRQLVGRGDVRRDPNPDDGRSYRLVLTAQGKATVQRGWPAVLAAYGRVARHLDRPASEHVAVARELRRAVLLAVDESKRERRQPDR